MAENPFLTSPFAPPAVARQPAETPAVDDQFVEAAPAKMQAPARRGMVPTRDDVARRASELGVDPRLALAIFNQESGGNFNSKDSPRNARGGFQVIPGTYKAMMGTDAGQRDAWNNMEAGLRYLAHGKKVLGTDDPVLLAAGYHSGMERKDLKAGRIPGTNDGMISTADYARSVAARVRGSRQPASRQPNLADQFTDTPEAAITPSASDFVDSLEEAKSAPQVQAAPGGQAAAIEPLIDIENKPYLDRLTEETKSGFGDMTRSLTTARWALGAGDAKSLSEDLAKSIQEQTSRPKTKAQQEIDAAYQGVTDAKGVIDTTAAGAKALWASLTNPKETSIEIARNAANSLPTLGAGAAGAAAGGAAGSVIPGAGTLAGAIAGGRTGMALGTTATELGAEIQDMVQKRLTESKQPPTAQNVLAILSDKDFQSQALKQGAAKGLTVAAVDQLFMGLGGKIATAPARKVATQELAEQGMDMATRGARNKALASPAGQAAIAAAKPALGARVGAGAAAVGVDAAGESLGEGLSQQVARGEVDYGEALREGVVSIGQSAAQTAVGATIESAKVAARAAKGAMQPTAAAPSTASGPLARATENAAAEPERVTVTAPDGQVTGTVTGQTDGGVQVVGDDGQVYHFATGPNGVQITPEAPNTPLSNAVEVAAGEVAVEPPAEAAPVDAPVAEAPPVESAPQAPEVAPAVESAAPEQPKALADLTEPELRERLKYIKQQAKPANGGWNKMLTDERKLVEREIDARTAQAAKLPQAKTPAQPTTLGTQVNVEAGPGFTAETMGLTKPAAEFTDTKAEALAAPEAAPVTQPAPPVATTEEGAGASQPPQAAPEQKPAKPKTASKAALDRIAKGSAYFGSADKAQAFITKNGLADTHTVEQTGKVRFDVKPKEQPNVADQRPQQQPAGTEAVGQEADAGQAAPAAVQPDAAQEIAPAQPKLVKIRTAMGDNVHVRQSDLDGDRVQLPIYTADGNRKGGTVHRDNLDPTGEKQAQANAEIADNPFFDVITRKGGEPFDTKIAARREMLRRGLGATHGVVAADTIRAGVDGYVIKRMERADVSKPAGREGYDTPVELDAASLKAIVEKTRGAPLVDKPAKLEAWRTGTAKTDPNKFPVELVFTPDGRLDVNDGRHRIALAAERGEKVTAFIDGKDAQRVQELLSKPTAEIDTTAKPVEAVQESDKEAPTLAERVRQSRKNAKAETAEEDDAPFTHAGLKIETQRVRSDDGMKTRWVVQTPENAEREAREERQIGGDRIVDSREQAIKVADEEVVRYADEQARKAEIDAASEAKQAEEDKRKAAKQQELKDAGRVDSVVERRKNAILDKPHKLPASLGLGTGTKREAMQKAVEEGRAIVAAQVTDTAAKKRDQEAVDKAKSAGYILGLSNENIPAVKAGLEAQTRLKANDYTKPEYRVYSGGNVNRDSFAEISKTEYDYAQELMAKQADKEPAEQTPAAQEPRTEYPFGQVANSAEDRFFRSRVRVLPGMKGDAAWEGEVGSILNGGRLVEVKRDGQDSRVRIPGDRIEVLRRVDSEQAEEVQANGAGLNGQWSAILAKVADDGKDQDKSQRSYRAFTSLVRVIGEPMADVWKRWGNFIGSNSLVDKTGDEVLRWMEGNLTTAMDGYVGGLPNPPVSNVATLAYMQKAAEAIEGREADHNAYIAKLEQQVSDVETLGGSQERIAESLKAIAQAKREFNRRKQEIQDGLKQAEQREKEQQSQAEAEEAAKFQPADMNELSKKPTPASINEWFMGTYKGAAAWTNGHIIDFISEPNLKDWQKRMSALRGKGEPVDVERVVPKGQGAKAKVIGVYAGEYATNKDGIVFMEADGRLMAVASKYFRYFANKFKGAEFYAYGAREPIGVYQDGKRVGLVMGIMLGEQERNLDEVKARIAANAQGEKKAEPEKTAPKKAEAKAEERYKGKPAGIKRGDSWMESDRPRVALADADVKGDMVYIKTDYDVKQIPLNRPMLDVVHGGEAAAKEAEDRIAAIERRDADAKEALRRPRREAEEWLKTKEAALPAGALSEIRAQWDAGDLSGDEMKAAVKQAAAAGNDTNKIAIRIGGGALPVALPKPSHEMTLADIRKAVTDAGLQGWKDGNIRLFEEEHGKAVKVALDAGQSVPDEVLADYIGLVRPDLTDNQADQMADDLAGKTGAERVKAMREWGKAAKAQAEKPRLTDAGEELTRNRRNRVTGITWSDVEGMNDTLKVKTVTKSNIWQKPNYEKLVEDGAPRWKVAVLKTIYDKLAAKPDVSRVATDDQMRRYVETMGKVRDAVMAELDRVESDPGVKAAFESDAVKSFASQGDDMVQAAAVMGLRGTMDGNRIMDAVFPTPEGAKLGRYDRTTEQGKDNNTNALLIGGNNALTAMQFGYKAIAKARDLLMEGFPTKQEAWEKSYAIKPKNDRFFVVKKGYTFRVADGHPEAGFETQEQAQEFARELTKRTGKPTPPSRGLDLDAATRTGPDWRNGKDVTADEVKTDFGFRGVNLGEYVKANQKVAQTHLNSAYDALMDLAELMSVPPKAISLNGTLGLAIGAQGSGRALAHFVPGVNEINITRDSGAGALAHEWGHALDHYFGVQQSERIAKSTDPFLTEHLSGKPEGVRPEVFTAFKALVDAMKNRAMTEEEARDWIKGERSKAEYSLKSAMSDMKPIDQASYDKAGVKLAAGDIGEAGADGVPANIAKFLAAARGGAVQQARLSMAAERVNALRDEVRFMNTHKPQTRTNYAKASGMMDADRQKAYWSTNVEMFARAFESFVMDALSERQRESLYLSGLSDGPMWQAWEKMSGQMSPYPKAEERLAINQAAQALVNAIETREDDSGNVAMFSRAIADTEPEAPAMSRAELEPIFEALEGRGLTRKRALDSLANLPEAAKIEYIENNFVDILEELNDSNLVDIKC